MGEQRRIGSSLRFASRPAIVATGTVVGPMEAKGPLTQWFDTVVDDAMYGERTPEKAERRFMQDAIDIALGNASLQPENVHLMVGGDLLNQIVTSAFTAAKYPAPFLGLYGACSTCTEGLIVAAAMVDAGYADIAVSVTSSHYQSAERQFRYPIELNIQRKATSQYCDGGRSDGGGQGRRKVAVTEATIGRVLDLGIKDPNQMGPAMAPAAADTLLTLCRPGKDAGST